MEFGTFAIVIAVMLALEWRFTHTVFGVGLTLMALWLAIQIGDLVVLTYLGPRSLADLMALMDGNGRAIFYLCTLAVLRLAIHAANAVVARTQLTFNLSATTPVGRRVELETPIVDGQGQVDLLGKTWTITGDDTPAGTSVRVTDIDGATLRVIAVTGIRPVRDAGGARAHDAIRSRPITRYDTLTTGAAGHISRFGALGPLYRAGGWAAAISLVVMASASIIMIAAALFRILSDMPVLEMAAASAVLAGYLVVLTVAIVKCIRVKPAAE